MFYTVKFEHKWNKAAVWCQSQKILFCSKQKQEINTTMANKWYEDTNIDSKLQARDLGIMMGNRATCNLDIINVVEKARNKIG